MNKKNNKTYNKNVSTNSDSYNKSIYFYLPGTYIFFPLYVNFFQFYDKYPYKFKDNAIIKSVYDAPGNIWNGGRAHIGVYSQKDLKEVKSFYEYYNIAIRFTFTNSLLTEHHLYDIYSNSILQIYGDGKHEILCNSPLLEKYIREQYGNSYRYISSTTKRITDSALLIKELQADYDLVVVDYDFNNNLAQLQSIPYKDKIELLCNAVCKPYCPQRLEHYKILSQSQLLNDQPPVFCEDCKKHFWQVKNTSINFLSCEKINSQLIPMGFQHYKLEGRTTDIPDLIEILLYYLVKEDYKMEVRDNLLHYMTQ